MRLQSKTMRLDTAKLLGFDQVNGRAGDARIGAKIGGGGKTQN